MNNFKSKMSDLAKLNNKHIEAELDMLNRRGQYATSYHKCELILIEWANGIEWYDDNKWYKEDSVIADLEKLPYFEDDTLQELWLAKKSKDKEEKDEKKKPSLRLMDLFSVAAYYTGNTKRAWYIQYRLLNSSFTDNTFNMERIKGNIHFSIEKIKKHLSFYPEDIIEKLQNKDRPKRGLVTLTMTTCKRFDLFKRTMNSFLNACKDVELIDRFIIIDDNSDDEDRKMMEHMYPFIELVRKTQEEKGHPISMNKIRDIVNTPYCLHLEDDHEFFCHRNYIRPSLRIMVENKEIKQVLFNENYGEISSDLSRIKGGEIRKTSKGKKFRVHVHYPIGTSAYQEYMMTLGGGSNTHWPHFSFRPSLFATDIWEPVGNYKMEQEFERNFARRYVDAGFKSAFLIGLHHIHIGRTSHDLKSGKEVENAYTLNNTRQWGY